MTGDISPQVGVSSDLEGPRPFTPPKRALLNFRAPHSSRFCFTRRVQV